MTLFILVAALLVAGVLGYVLRPLLRGSARQRISNDDANVAVYRDQQRELEADLKAGSIDPEQYQRARLELEKRLLEDVGGASAQRPVRRAPFFAIATGVAVPLLAIAVYLVVGNPAAIMPGAMQQAAGHEVTPEQIAAMIDRLAERMKQNPDDAEGWAMLARSYNAIGRFSEASAAFAQASKRMPQDAQLLADYADALGMAQGKSLAGEPEKLIARSLQLDPNNIKALALAGSAAFDRKDYKAASQQWERILTVAPPESQLAQSIRPSIDEARGLAGLPPFASAPQAAPPDTARPPIAAAEGARITGVARLSPELAQKTSPDDTVFVFARAAQGPKMPLAILKKQVRDLPLSFVLDDSMAMNGEMKLSSFPSVVVSARVSKSANAVAKPGDFEGESAPVKIGAERVDVVINSEVR